MDPASVSHPLPVGSALVTPPANAGCVVVVPEPSPNQNYKSYYRVLAFLAATSQPTTTTIQVPPSQVPGLQPLLVNLPNGVSTPLAEIAAAIYQYQQTQPVPIVAPTGFGPIPAAFGFGSEQSIISGTDPRQNPYLLKPVALGSAVLAPLPTSGSIYQSYYLVLAYLDATAGATSIQLPSVPGILIVDLPNGIYTTSTEIVAIATNGGGGGPPGGANGTIHP